MSTPKRSIFSWTTNRLARRSSSAWPDSAGGALASVSGASGPERQTSTRRRQCGHSGNCEASVASGSAAFSAISASLSRSKPSDCANSRAISVSRPGASTAIASNSVLLDIAATRFRLISVARASSRAASAVASSRSYRRPAISDGCSHIEAFLGPQLSRVTCSQRPFSMMPCSRALLWTASQPDASTRIHSRSIASCSTLGSGCAASHASRSALLGSAFRRADSSLVRSAGCMDMRLTAPMPSAVPRACGTPWFVTWHSG